METEALKQQLKEQIIALLNLAPMQPDEIKDEEPLFNDGLGLDSIDSLELIVLLQREYGIKIENPKDGRKILFNVSTMVDFIEKNRTR